MGHMSSMGRNRSRGTSVSAVDPLRPHHHAGEVSLTQQVGMRVADDAHWHLLADLVDQRVGAGLGGPGVGSTGPHGHTHGREDEHRSQARHGGPWRRTSITTVKRFSRRKRMMFAMARSPSNAGGHVLSQRRRIGPRLPSAGLPGGPGADSRQRLGEPIGVIIGSQCCRA